jgi:hypothetical protein
MSRNILRYIMPSCALFLLTLSASPQTPNPTTSTTPRVQTKRPQTSPTEAKVEMATWNPDVGKSIGFTKEEFDSMGLGKMTSAEYFSFLLWASARQQNAAQNAIASQPKFSCGRSSTDAIDYDRVNIFISIADSTPAELASRIRQNLRALSDVQIVYSGEDADLIVDIVGFDLETISNQKTGYVASVVASTPCISRYGTQQETFRQLQNSYLQTGGLNMAQLAESVTTTLDSRDIESARKSNATIKQIIKGSKK